MNGILWGGWIQGREDQKEALRSLGVKGEMRWHPSTAHRPGVFEQCDCNEATMFRLIADWPGFKAGTFTGYWVHSEVHLPRRWQKFGRLDEQLEERQNQLNTWTMKDGEWVSLFPAGHPEPRQAWDIQ